MHKPKLVKGAILPERAVKTAAEACGQRDVVERASDVTLVEECDDLIAGLEARDVLADRDDRAGAVGARN